MGELPELRRPSAQAEAEYRRAERELELSGEAYRAFFEESRDATYIVTRDGRLVEFNQAMLDLFGHTREELLGLNVRERYVNPSDRDKFQREIEARGAVKDYEVKLRRKDGREMDCLLTTTVWRAADGTVLGYRGLIRDITERKQREQALRQRTVYLAALYRMSQAVSGSVKLEEVLDTALEVALEVTGLDAGVVWLPGPGDGLTLRIAASRGVPPDYPVRLQEARKARGRPGIVEALFQSGEAAFLEDIAQDSRLAFPDLLKSFGFVSAAVMPLRHREQPLGLLDLLSRTPHSFSRWEQELLLAVGEQVSIAIHRAQAEEALRQSEERLRAIVDTARDCIITVDSRANIVSWNRAAEAIFGYSAEEVIGKPLMLVMPERYREPFAQAFRRRVWGGEATITDRVFEMPALRKDGSEVLLEFSVAAWETNEGVFFAAIIRDISERKRMEEQLVHAATHDALTDLPNRALLNDRLTLELAHASRNQQRLALLSLDLDHFKEVNDTLGHKVGDQLLQAVGERLREALRKSDTVARMGGDEFMLILPGITRPEDFVRVAQKVLDVVREPFLLAGHTLRITTSIGVTIYPDDGPDVDVLLRNADIALYQAKRMGRDNYQRYVPTLAG